MDAHSRTLRTCLSLLLTLAAATSLQAAAYQTQNFTVQAPTARLAREIGDQAEVYRRDLAIEWLGTEMPPWSRKCPIRAQVAPTLGAGGATSFMFNQGEVYGWEMDIQGSRQRVLDSVLPHEVTHTIFASHFRQPLPRWADEGACTTVEHHSEIGKQERMLIRFLKTGKGIPFSRMFAMKEYPRDVMPLYSQGHSLTTFLIEQRGKKVFLDFLAMGMADENWPAAIRKHYGQSSLHQLQNDWLAWVKQGRPRLSPEAIASASAAAPADAVASNAQPMRQPVRPASGVTPIPGSRATASVYAAFGDSAASTPDTASTRGSIYDASRGTGTILRKPAIVR